MMESLETVPSPPVKLTVEQWEQYKKTLEDWLAQWDVRENETFQQLARDPKWLATFQWHPANKGKTQAQVFQALLREARQAQVARKLYETNPKRLKEEMEVASEAVALGTPWIPFGGGDWGQMSYRELEESFRRPWQARDRDWVDLDHGILAQNRLSFELYTDVMQRTITLDDYLHGQKTAALHPNETNAAFLLRKSRPYALGIGLVALLISWALDVPNLRAVGIGLLAYVLMSFWLYPKLLGKSES